MNEEVLKLWARRLAPILSLLATCLGYLVSKHYPMMTAEVFILLSGAVILGAAIGYVCEWLSEWQVAIICAGLLIVTAIFAFNILDILSSVGGDAIPDKTVRHVLKFFTVFVLPLSVALAIRREVPLVLSCAMVVFIIGILAFPARNEDQNAPVYSSAETSAEVPRRLVLHIIFDEFAGNSGIAPSFPDGDGLRRDVSTFFVRHGFRLYEGAFSTYSTTRYSVPALFSFSHPQPNKISKEPDAWFEKLNNDGYKIVYIGSDYAPICNELKNPKLISRCSLYPLLMDIKSIHDSQESPWRKASEIIQTSLWNFEYFNNLMIRYRVITDVLSKKLSPADDTRRTLLRDGGDLAIITHILLPHSPMLYDENCKQHPELLLLQNTAPYGSARLAYERAYAGQVRCTLKQLDSILQIVDRRWPDATVIVNGDHGLRLHPFTYDREDIRLRYAALFAIRTKGVAPGIVPQEHNMQMLFAQYAGGLQISDSRVLYGSNILDENAEIAYPK